MIAASGGRARRLLPLGGIGAAILLHGLYNNALFALPGEAARLFSSLAIGLGSAALLVALLEVGLRRERSRLARTLQQEQGISAAERQAVEQMGGEGVARILAEIRAIFGPQQAELIHDLLARQANLGILENNLSAPAGERLRAAWQAEIAELRAEIDDLRRQLGAYSMALLRSLLPTRTPALWADFTTRLAQHDPLHVHSFDLFIAAGKHAGTLSPEEVEQAADRLKRISIFQQVPLGDLDSLARAITPRHYRSGEILFRRGQPGDTMVLIERGFIDILIHDPQGGERLLRTYQGGDVVGELALLDGQPRSATARANSSVSAMVLQREHFLMFIQSRPRVILGVLGFLADRLRYTTQAMTREEVNINPTRITALDVGPAASDTIHASDAPLGVFGRLSAALDDLEAASED
ncbi:MAG: cyclic nucleotide-binding domain-containing protein [Anaerolineae bacterium]|nr:cyclic nucleotide-binding domain-containing protein [Anaerolineae bacterium]